MTATEIRKTKEMQAIPAAAMMDISDAASSIMFALETACKREIRTENDQRVINLLIRAAKKLPIYIDDLQKYC